MESGGPGNIPEHLRDFIPTNENAAALREKIIRGLRYWCGRILSKGTDVEALAQEILLEAWKTPRPVTSLFIYHRALDAQRTQRNYARLKREFTFVVERHQYSFDNRSTLDTKTRLNAAFKEADLSPMEFMLVYLVFDRGCTLQECSVEMKRSLSWVKDNFGNAMEKLKTAGRIVQARENEKKRRK